MNATSKKAKAPRGLRLATILVPTDFSEEARKALEYGRALGESFRGEVHLLHAHEGDFSYGVPAMMGPGTKAAVGNAIEESLRKRLEELGRKFSLAQDSKQRHVRIGRAYNAICEVAEKIGADLIVIGTHGYGGWRRFFLGSTAERVVQHAPCPVLVVRERERDSLEPSGGSLQIRKILAPVDFSECSRKGLRYAIDFAANCGASVTLLHTIQVQPLIPSEDMAELTHMPAPGVIERAARMEMRKLEKAVAFGEVKHDTQIRAGRAALEICRFAEQSEADLIVTSTHGATGLEHVLIGSTAERVVRHAPCPVLIVPARRRAKREAA